MELTIAFFGSSNNPACLSNLDARKNREVNQKKGLSLCVIENSAVVAILVTPAVQAAFDNVFKKSEFIRDSVVNGSTQTTGVKFASMFYESGSFNGERTGLLSEVSDDIIKEVQQACLATFRAFCAQREPHYAKKGDEKYFPNASSIRNCECM